MKQTGAILNNHSSIDRVSVLSLNIRFGLADDGPNSWEYRKNSFPGLLKKYRADFIGFQEVNNFQSDFLKNILYEYNCIGERKPAPSSWQNNVIFYHKKWECVHQNHFYLSPTPDIPSRFKKSRWPRQCTIGMFKNSIGSLTIANTHFDFDISVQTKSAKLILHRLSKIPAEIPAILIGDFNAEPYSPSYNIFTGEKTNEGLNEKESFKNIFKKPFPGTFHGFNEDTTGDHIDWILYRGGLIPEKSGIIRETINSMYPSDHFPLFAIFKRKNEEK